MRSVENIPLGILIERRESASSWQRWLWRPVAVVPAGARGEGWQRLRDDGRVGIFHAGQLPLRLYPDEAETYLENVGRERPDVYVVLRAEAGEAGCPVRPVLLTASPDEAAAYSEVEEAVHPVAMPPAVAVEVRRFAEAHYRPEPFVRRNRREREAREAEKTTTGPIARRRPAWRMPGAS